MEIKAISTPIFKGNNHNRINNRKQSVENDYPQMDAPMSKNTSKAMRDLTMGLMALGAVSQGLTSCQAEASASASASSSATAVAIGGHCHHRDTVTIIKPDTIHETDTVIHTIIKPINVKDYPYNIGDSLIAQGRNIGVPVDGPIPDGTNNAVYMGSKAHNRYDNKFYESMVDSIGTSSKSLAVVTKIVDMYDAKHPKTSYMKAIVTDVPGKGIKISRYVANTDKKPEEYMWNYAGYEVRTNGRNGKRNTRSIFDNQNNLIYRGDYEKGENPGTFLYGSLIYDDATGEPIYNDKGDPEFAQYDFDQAVIYSDYAKTYTHPGWDYGE